MGFCGHEVSFYLAVGDEGEEGLVMVYIAGGLLHDLGVFSFHTYWRRYIDGEVLDVTTEEAGAGDILEGDSAGMNGSASRPLDSLFVQS